MALTDIGIRALKPRPVNAKLSDGGGLHLLLTPAGGKLWKLAYRFGGKQKTLSLGAYPAIGLLDARRKRDAAKADLAAGVDPGAKAKPAAEPDTFEVLAREWYASQIGDWAESHAQRIMARFEADVFPAIGSSPLADIAPLAVLEMLRTVEARGALDVAKRIRQTCSQVFRYAIATGRADRDPSGDLRGAMKRSPKVKHFAALQAHDIREFLSTLALYDGEPGTRFAIYFTLLTFVRTSETRLARWSEFECLDGSAPIWRIPGERMKAGREHVVPLSRQCVELLGKIKELSGKRPVLFPSHGREGVLSQNAMIFALYRMGYHSRLTIHGFRGTASTILNEHGCNSDHIELQLAHVERDDVRGAYNSAQWIEPRRVMMQWWADYIAAQGEPF